MGQGCCLLPAAGSPAAVRRRCLAAASLWWREMDVQEMPATQVDPVAVAALLMLVCIGGGWGSG